MISRIPDPLRGLPWTFWSLSVSRDGIVPNFASGRFSPGAARHDPAPVMMTLPVARDADF
jgi:hypothetical protein